MSTHPSSAFYALPLTEAATPVCNAVVGQFSGGKQQELIVPTANALSVYKIDGRNGRLRRIHHQEVYGIVRSLAAFRLPGSSKDQLLVGSDSGQIAVLDYSASERQFRRLHLESFGRSGVRRVVPGEHMAVDPKGRAVMLAALEKNKVVYVLNRDAEARVTISSPLEASVTGTLVYHLVALDAGYDNPIFAALEINCGDIDQDSTDRAVEETAKVLTYYELDLGLNHVLRAWQQPVDRAASYLVPLPGGYDGPGGVLVCSPGRIEYRHKDRPISILPIPQRRGAYETHPRDRIIVASVTHKLKDSFFVLLQTNDGDFFKLSVDHHEGRIEGLTLQYFDTVPVALSLNIFKSGYLYAATELGNGILYQFERLGDDEDEKEFFSTSEEVDLEPVYFSPRPLTNLSVMQQDNSLHTVLDCAVVNLTDDDVPQMYFASGRGAQSTFKTVRHGLEVTEVVASDLPGRPTAVWTTKLRHDDIYDSYMVLSFLDATLVLSIGEEVEELTDTGFLTTTATLAVQQLGTDALIQVYAKGIRHIRSDGMCNVWEAPQHRTILQASTNNRQVVVALSSGELVYFELDMDEQLNEYEDRKEMSGSVTALSLGEVPNGRLRNPYLAVACDDSTVRVLSLEPDNTLESLSLQALTAPASSLLMMQASSNNSDGLYLHIGLSNGVYLRTSLELSTGQLVDTRTRFLGASPISLVRVEPTEEVPAVLALSTRPWLGYIWEKAMQLLPLHTSALAHAASFSSEQCAHGIVAVQDTTLRIFTVDRLDTRFRIESVPLNHTPRKFCQHPSRPLFYVVQADHHAQTVESALAKAEGRQNGDATVLPASTFGQPWAPEGHWASCIQIVDPVSQQVIATVGLEADEAAFACTTVTFESRPNDIYLAVGTATKAVLVPKSCEAASILIYKVVDDGRALEFVHRTDTEEIPLALMAFQGRLAAGCGKLLRLYDIGKKRLLRKCEQECGTTAIVRLHTEADRIVVCDALESVRFLAYSAQRNALLPFADDTVRRWVSASCMVDYDTIAGGDRMGNFWLVRLPKDVSRMADDDITGHTLSHEKPYLAGAAHRLELVAHYHLADVPVAMVKTQLVAGGRPVVVVAGLQGSLTLLIPFPAREDADFFGSLERALRNLDADVYMAPPGATAASADPNAPQGVVTLDLLGRDHGSFRGAFAPCRAVVDGGFCETFLRLPHDRRARVAAELDREPAEVIKKIEEMRIRYGY